MKTLLLYGSRKIEVPAVPYTPLVIIPCLDGLQNFPAQLAAVDLSTMQSLVVSAMHAQVVLPEPTCHLLITDPALCLYTHLAFYHCTGVQDWLDLLAQGFFPSLRSLSLAHTDTALAHVVAALSARIALNLPKIDLKLTIDILLKPGSSALAPLEEVCPASLVSHTRAIRANRPSRTRSRSCCRRRRR